MVTQEVIWQNGHVKVLKHNDHYHGHDHVTYIVSQWLGPSRTEQHNHRSEPAARRHAEQLVKKERS
jgi:hypothetical protein